MNGVYNSAVRTEKSDEVVDEPLLKEKLMERKKSWGMGEKMGGEREVDGRMREVVWGERSCVRKRMLLGNLC